MMIETAFEIDSNSSHMWFSLGYELLYILKKKQESIQCFEKSLEIDPSNLNALNGIAYAKMSKKNRDVCIEYFDRILEIDPFNLKAWKSKGFYLALYDGNPLEAIDCLKKVVCLAPNHPWSYYYLVMALSDVGKEDEALEYANKALELEPYCEPLIYCKLHILENLKKYQELFELCDSVLKKTDEEKDDWITARSYYMKANALANLKKFKDALIAYDEAYGYGFRAFADFENKKRVLEAIKTGSVSNIPFGLEEDGKKFHFSLIYTKEKKNND